MTVKELIAELSKYPKDTKVGVAKRVMRMGSSWTGAYCAGESCIEIEDVIFVNGDSLAGLSEIDECGHIEIKIDDDDDYY